MNSGTPMRHFIPQLIQEFIQNLEWPLFLRATQLLVAKDNFSRESGRLAGLDLSLLDKTRTRQSLPTPQVRTSRRSTGRSSASGATCGMKSRCLHPDKPMMFACADCPRRANAAAEGLDEQPIAVAAFLGEEAASKGCCAKSRCLHPDKPMMFACADCPRRANAAAEGLDEQPMAVAAFVGEEVASKGCCAKSRCLHPDKPMMFACPDCPRRANAAAEGLDEQPMAVAAFVGEEVAGKGCCAKSRCLHPDKPMMFACPDCPRRANAAAEGLDEQPMAVAAFVGEEVPTNVCSAKSRCLHPDKPMMFACPDCPRRSN